MSAFLLYIIRSGCCLALFYLGYKALLSRETFFAFNRKVLLGGMMLSLLLPLVQFRLGEASLIQKPYAELLLLLDEKDISSYPLEEEPGVLPQPAGTDQQRFSFSVMLGGLYLLGVLVAFIRTIVSFHSLVSFLRKGRIVRKRGYVLVLMDKEVVPFNWGGYVVMSESEYQDSPDGIVAHELAHLRKRHSVDLFFVEAILLFYWFNPAVWLLRHELKNTHEFEADAEVLHSGIDATKYQLLLVKKAVDAGSYSFVNSFNQSKLKTRITMMFKNRSNKQARWKLMLFVPLATLAVYSFARPEVNRQLQLQIPGEDTKIAQTGQSFSCESFNEEFRTYYDKVYGTSTMSLSEKFDRMKEQGNLFVVLVNAEDRLLLQNLGKNLILTADELKPELERAIVAGRSDRVTLIYFLFDQDTSDDVKRTTLDVIGSLVVKCSTKEAPVLVFCGDRKDYSS